MIDDGSSRWVIKSPVGRHIEEPSVDPLLDDDERESGFVDCHSRPPGGRGRSLGSHISDGCHELLRFVLLHQLHLTIAHAVTEDDYVLWPILVHFVVLQ